MKLYEVLYPKCKKCGYNFSKGGRDHRCGVCDVCAFPNKKKARKNLHEGYNAYVLDEQSKNQLAKRFPPKYPEWIGHHITVDFGVPKDPSLPYGDVANVKVVGYAEDDGIETLIVAVNDETKRPDGKTYHITWSLDRAKERKPVDSNKVIAERGFTKVTPIVVRATLQYFY